MMWCKAKQGKPVHTRAKGYSLKRETQLVAASQGLPLPARDFAVYKRGNSSRKKKKPSAQYTCQCKSERGSVIELFKIQWEVTMREEGAEGKEESRLSRALAPSFSTQMGEINLQQWPLSASGLTKSRKKERERKREEERGRERGDTHYK